MHFSLDTSAAQLALSDMRSKAAVEPRPGFGAAVQERTNAEAGDWAKLVVAVTSR